MRTIWQILVINQAAFVVALVVMILAKLWWLAPLLLATGIIGLALALLLLLGAWAGGTRAPL